MPVERVTTACDAASQMPIVVPSSLPVEINHLVTVRHYFGRSVVLVEHSSAEQIVVEIAKDHSHGGDGTAGGF